VWLQGGDGCGISPDAIWALLNDAMCTDVLVEAEMMQLVELAADVLQWRRQVRAVLGASMPCSRPWPRGDAADVPVAALRQELLLAGSYAASASASACEQPAATTASAAVSARAAAAATLAAPVPPAPLHALEVTREEVPSTLAVLQDLAARGSQVCVACSACVPLLLFLLLRRPLFLSLPCPEMAPSSCVLTAARGVSCSSESTSNHFHSLSTSSRV
jgi:hypothetical protein